MKGFGFLAASFYLAHLTSNFPTRVLATSPTSKIEDDVELLPIDFDRFPLRSLQEDPAVVVIDQEAATGEKQLDEAEDPEGHGTKSDGAIYPESPFTQ